MKKTGKMTVLLLLVLLVISLFAGCYTLGERKPIATLEFSNGKVIQFRLYPDKAPNTVNNFIALANSGFYDNSPVHRIKEYFVIQMGKSGADPSIDNAGYYIKGEFTNNGFSKNDISHEEGIVSMARVVGPEGSEADYYDTASSQFFIMLTNKPHLDGDYAAFGKVIRGMEYVQKISKMDVDSSEHPRDEIYIKSLTVETYGKTYPEPDTIPID